MFEEPGRKVHKPPVVVEDDNIGLLEEDETMTNQEFTSVFHSTGIFDEKTGRMVFDAEVINKFKRVLLYQEKLEPLREEIVFLQFEKYFADIDDVNKEKSKQMTITLFGENPIKDATILASKEDGEYVYVSVKIFKRMLKILGDTIIHYLKVPEGEQFISLRLWAFDNDFDMIYSEENLKIGYFAEESEESEDEQFEETTEKISKQNSNKKSTQEKNTNNLTASEYNSIFNTDCIESGEDVEIKPSVIKKLEELVDNLKAIKPVREQFAYRNVYKFIDEDLDIDNLICDEFEVYINDRVVGKFKVYRAKETSNNFYINMFCFKLLLIRAGSYYAIYLKGNKTDLVNLDKWTEENCGEINSDENLETGRRRVNITF